MSLKCHLWATVCSTVRRIKVARRINLIKELDVEKN